MNNTSLGIVSAGYVAVSTSYIVWKRKGWNWKLSVLFNNLSSGIVESITKGYNLIID